MRFLVPALTALLLSTSAAQAAWLTTVEDDLFSGGKIATMIGGSPSSGFFVHIFCRPDQPPVLKILQQDDSSGNDASEFTPADMVMATDEGYRWEHTGILSRHNANFYGAESLAITGLGEVVEAIGKAGSDIQFGIDIPTTGYRNTASIDAIGSTAAAKQMLDACDFDQGFSDPDAEVRTENKPKPD